MAKQSLNQRIQEAEKIGRKNKRLWPKVDNWCKHLEIEMTSAGLIAQMSQLPVGSLRIECDHAASGGVESMHLEQVASSFIVRNCRGCPYHEMVNSDNIGREIIEEYERSQESKKEEEEESEVEKSRDRLQGLVSGDLEEALDERDPTKQSISKLVLLLDQEEQAYEAAEKLAKAAQLEPDWFSDDAVQVICSHFPDPSHGRECISCIRTLGRTDDIVVESAWRCVKSRRNADATCALIGDHWQENGDDVTTEKLGYVAAVPSFTRSLVPPGPVRGKSAAPSYVGSFHALKAAGESASEALLTILHEYVSQDIPSSRVNAANIIQRLTDDFPGIAFKLVSSLLEALELEDSRSSYDSADAAVCQALAVLYARDPEAVQSEIDRAYRRASDEAREAIMGVYRAAVNNARGASEEQKALSVLPQVISVLLRVIGGLYYSVDVKRDASETLHQIARSHPSVVEDHLEGLLGTLGTLTREQDSIAQSQDQNESFETSLDHDTKVRTYGYAAQKIVASVKKVASESPRAVFDLVTDINGELSSSKSYESRYRQRLVSIYDSFAADPHLAADLIPELYKALMDFDSVRVRGEAVKTLGDILRHHSEIVPRKMIETLVYVHLQDSYVHVHKHAVRALRHCELGSGDLLVEASNHLLRWYATYNDEPHFRKTILESLKSITFDHPSLIQSITGPIALDLAGCKDTYVTGDALLIMKSLLPGLDDGFAAKFVHRACKYLEATHRDRYNNSTYSDRFRILTALYEQPSDVIQGEIERIKDAARSKFEDDPYDAVQFVYLLSHHEMYDEAYSLLRELMDSLDDVRKNQRLLRRLKLEGGILEANQEVLDNEPSRALQVLNDVQDEFEAIQNEENQPRPRSLLDTVQVAEKIAGRHS